MELIVLAMRRYFKALGGWLINYGDMGLVPTNKEKVIDQGKSQKERLTINVNCLQDKLTWIYVN